MTTPAQAIAEREAEPAALSPVEIATVAVEQTLPRFQAVLPKGWDRDRFTNLVVAAVRREPGLIRCFTTDRGRTSLLISAIQCAAMGLEPNTPLREAALVPRKIKGVDEATLMVEYRGLVKLARRSGEIENLYAEVVHARDEFVYELGAQPRLEHRPYDGDDDPGELTHAYAVVHWRGGGSQFVVLPRRVVHNQHRAHSDSWRADQEKGRRNSPWTNHPEAMWRKTAVRVLEPFLPLTTELHTAIAVDDTRFDLQGDQLVPIDTAGALATDEVIDHDTGEILDAGSGEPRDVSRGDSEISEISEISDEHDDEDAAWIAQAKGEQP